MHVNVNTKTMSKPINIHFAFNDCLGEHNKVHHTFMSVVNSTFRMKIFLKHCSEKKDVLAHVRGAEQSAVPPFPLCRPALKRLK